jgi:hypothetical protein
MQIPPRLRYILGMYLRTTKRKNRDGTVVTYHQLAHNYRDPETNKIKARIIYNFGRADKIDRNDLVRLCRSIARVCGLHVEDPLDAFPQKSPSNAKATATAESKQQHLWNGSKFQRK